MDWNQLNTVTMFSDSTKHGDFLSHCHQIVDFPLIDDLYCKLFTRLPRGTYVDCGKVAFASSGPNWYWSLNFLPPPAEVERAQENKLPMAVTPVSLNEYIDIPERWKMGLCTNDHTISMCMIYSRIVANPFYNLIKKAKIITFSKVEQPRSAAWEFPSFCNFPSALHEVVFNLFYAEIIRNRTAGFLLRCDC